MCGIVGAAIREGTVLPILLRGLKSLEYRGYDSAGLAVHGSKVAIRRANGRVQELEDLTERDPLGGDCLSGIAHTRWATHGVPSERNAHPQRCGPLVLVHNGIFENHEDFRQRFEQDGKGFASDTDTEVWAALIATELGDDLDAPDEQQVLAAVARGMKQAKGSYALAIVHDELPGRVFFARKESPLVLGVGKDGNYIASDIAALLETTHDFLYVEDDMLGYVMADEYHVFDGSLEPCRLPVDHVEWDAEAASKGGYEHYMLKEIEEQADVFAKTLSSVTSDTGRILPEFEIEDSRLRGFDRLVILACGTALHAARLGKYIIEHAAEIPVEVDFASEFRYRDPMVGPKDLVMAISQSGETTDTLGAMRVAIEKGATPIAICNVRGSSLCRLSDATILTQCGPEIGVASTKAFTAQLLALHLFSMRLGMARRVMSTEELIHRHEVLRQTKIAMEGLLRGSPRDKVRELGRKYAMKPCFFFLGRGPDYPIALEGALKLKEISYVHAEGYPAGEMKHGPLALVSEDMVVVAIAGSSDVYEKVLGSIQEVKARGGTVIVITNEDCEEAIALADEYLLVPKTDPLTAPLLHVVPLQYFAYQVALERGCDIDKPRNLAKSVTVE